MAAKRDMETPARRADLPEGVADFLAYRPRSAGPARHEPAFGPISIEDVGPLLRPEPPLGTPPVSETRRCEFSAEAFRIIEPRGRNTPGIDPDILDRDLLRATLEETDHELLDRMLHAGPQSDRVFVDGKTFELLEPRGPGFPEPVSRAGLVARWIAAAALAGSLAYCAAHRASEESPAQQDISGAVHNTLYPSPKFD